MALFLLFVLGPMADGQISIQSPIVFNPPSYRFNHPRAIGHWTKQGPTREARGTGKRVRKPQHMKQYLTIITIGDLTN